MQRVAQHIHKLLRQGFWARTIIVCCRGLVWFNLCGERGYNIVTIEGLNDLQFSDWDHVSLDTWGGIGPWPQEAQFTKIYCPDSHNWPIEYFGTSADMVPNFFLSFVRALLESSFKCLEGFVVCAFLLHTEEKLFHENKHWFQICFGGNLHFMRVWALVQLC